MIQVGENVGFEELDRVAVRRVRRRKPGWARRRLVNRGLQGMGATVNTLPLYANLDQETAPSQRTFSEEDATRFQGLETFDDFSQSTPLVTIDEEASLEDLAALESLERLESLGQLDDLGKSKLKKLRKKLVKTVKKVAKTVARATPLVMTAMAAKKMLTRKKERKEAKKTAAAAAAYAAEEAKAAQEYAGITDAQWKSMTPTQRESIIAQYRAAVEASERGTEVAPAVVPETPGVPASVPPELTPEQAAAYERAAVAARAGAAASGGGAMLPAEAPEGDYEYEEEGAEAPESEEASAKTSLPSVVKAYGGEKSADSGEVAKNGDKTMPGWVLPVGIVGAVAVVGIAAYFMFFKKN